MLEIKMSQNADKNERKTSQVSNKFYLILSLKLLF